MSINQDFSFLFYLFSLSQASAKQDSPYLIYALCDVNLTWLKSRASCFGVNRHLKDWSYTHSTGVDYTVQTVPALQFLFLSLAAFRQYISYPLFLIFTAALWSRSISFPQLQTYLLSDSAIVFTLPHTQQVFVDGNHGSTLTRYFPRSASLYSSIVRNMP